MPKTPPPPPKNTTRLWHVTVHRITDEHVLFTHTGIQYWAPLYAFHGHPNLTTKLLTLRNKFAHHVVPNRSPDHQQTDA